MFGQKLQGIGLLFGGLLFSQFAVADCYCQGGVYIGSGQCGVPDSRGGMAAVFNAICESPRAYQQAPQISDAEIDDMVRQRDIQLAFSRQTGDVGLAVFAFAETVIAPYPPYVSEKELKEKALNSCRAKQKKSEAESDCETYPINDGSPFNTITLARGQKKHGEWVLHWSAENSYSVRSSLQAIENVKKECKKTVKKNCEYLGYFGLKSGTY